MSSVFLYILTQTYLDYIIIDDKKYNIIINLLVLLSLYLFLKGYKTGDINQGNTFAELAETPVEKIKEILDAAGPRFQMHDPATWPQQSAMARDGKWDELKKWQEELNKGKA